MKPMLPEECRPKRRRRPWWATELAEQLEHLNKGIRKIMAAVQVEQTDLDTLATNLESAISAVSTEIQNLEAQVAAGQPLAAGSLDGLNSALANLQGLEVPAPAPVEPTPTPDPTPPTS